MVDVELLRTKQLDNTSFIEIDKDGNEEKITGHVPKYQLEFRGSNNFYLCDAAKYICTHHRDNLNVRKTYIDAELSFDKFLDITIGEFKDQRQKLMDELSNTGKHKCYIPNGEGSIFIMTPFNIVYETAEQKSSNINAPKIKKVYFSFPTPIFKEYLFDENKQYYRHPVNLYAKIYDILKKMISELKNENRQGFSYEELLQSPTFVEGYIKFFDYFYKHGAGDSRKESLSVNEADLMKTCIPSLIHIDGAGKVKIREPKKYEAFFKMAAVISNMIKGFDYQIVGAPKKDQSDFGKRGYMKFNLTHPVNKFD
jgi:hypothetical protein